MKIEAFNNQIYFAKKKTPSLENNFLKNNKRKIIAGGSFGLGGAVLASIYAVKKAQKINKIKQELIKTYDLIYEEMAIEAQQMGLNFVKPELEFRNIPKNTTACHLVGKNKIIINTKKLSDSAMVRYKDGKCEYDVLKDGKRIPYSYFALPFGESLPKDCTYITGDEKLFILASSLKHELTHAKQEQFMLSAKKSVENLYAVSKKKDPKLFERITLDDYKKLFEFYGNYKPKTLFDLDERRVFEFECLKNLSGYPMKISYSPDDVIKYNLEYNSNDLDLYYKNPLEIEARAQQLDFCLNYKRYMPNIKIKKQVQDYYVKALSYACQTLLS